MASKWRLNKSEEKEVKLFAEAEAAKAEEAGGDKSEAYSKALATKTKEIKEGKAAKAAAKKSGGTTPTSGSTSIQPAAPLKSPGQLRYSKQSFIHCQYFWVSFQLNPLS